MSFPWALAAPAAERAQGDLRASPSKTVLSQLEGAA
jgi:hypothetical protein